MNQINVEIIPFLLPAMTFCHVIADYNLQGILANFKQKAGELNFCPHCGADMRDE